MLWTSDKSVDLADRLCPPLGENSVIQMFVSQDCTCEDSTDGRCHPATAVPISPSTRSCSQACFRKGCMCACTVAHCIWLFVTPWTVANQAPLSMQFSRQEYWSGLSCPPPGNLTDPGIEPIFPAISCIGRRIFFFFLTTSTTWKWTSLVAQMVKRLSTMREAQVRSLGWEDPLEKDMTTHSSTLSWKIPWTEEHGRLQSTGSQRVGHDWATSLSFFPFTTWKASWKGWGVLIIISKMWY